MKLVTIALFVLAGAIFLLAAYKAARGGLPLLSAMNALAAGMNFAVAALLS